MRKGTFLLNHSTLKGVMDLAEWNGKKVGF